jgi:hypothetical protein
MFINNDIKSDSKGEGGHSYADESSNAEKSHKSPIMYVIFGLRESSKNHNSRPKRATKVPKIPKCPQFNALSGSKVIFRVRHRFQRVICENSISVKVTGNFENS